MLSLVFWHSPWTLSPKPYASHMLLLDSASRVRILQRPSISGHTNTQYPIPNNNSNNNNNNKILKRGTDMYLFLTMPIMVPSGKLIEIGSEAESGGSWCRTLRLSYLIRGLRFSYDHLLDAPIVWSMYVLYRLYIYFIDCTYILWYIYMYCIGCTCIV